LLTKSSSSSGSSSLISNKASPKLSKTTFKS
jgi:hypothetical protein